MCDRLTFQPAVRIVVTGFPPTARQRYISVTTLLSGRLKIAITSGAALNFGLQVARLQRGLN